MPLKNLKSFVQFLEKQNNLKRITAPVDPELEITEIACRVVKNNGPALLFESVKGSSIPLLINLFGSPQRIQWALHDSPQSIGQKIKSFFEDMMPPSFPSLWTHKNILWRGLQMKQRYAAKAPVLKMSESPNLHSLPVLKCWPQDGGPFITFPLVITQSPNNKCRNTGIYRMHCFDQSHTGMHWQVAKGGGFHYGEAERQNQELPVAVVIGCDPVTMLAGALPLPEDMDELAFAGFLRNSRTAMTRLSNGLSVPANAEIILEGTIAPHQRQTEGPFGDHFGHYSAAASFPVFHIHKIHRRQNPIYAASVVGKPPQEDKHIGNAVQEMLLPLLKLLHPELIDLWAYYEAGFHNLLVASVKQRYKKEALKTAFGLLGQGQMSLTKCLILVDPEVNVRHFSHVLKAIRENFDPQNDFYLIPGTSQDTLDFTGHAMNLGSKMIINATCFETGRRGDRETGRQGDGETRRWGDGGMGRQGDGVVEHRNLKDCLLVVKVKGNSRDILQRLVNDPVFSSFRLIAAVSEDVPLEDEELLIWGIFTRFDCARDIIPRKTTIRGAWSQYQGPLGIDATWKQGYPDPVIMDPSIVDRVNKRWDEYKII